MLDKNALTKALGDLDEQAVLAMLRDFVGSKPSKDEAEQAVLACQDGMAVVSTFFDNGDYFVGDLMYAGEILTQAIDILQPVIGGSQRQKVGTIVLGTVKGDIHDIGKNIFKSMAIAAGFDVHDLGVDVPVQEFVEKTRQLQPDIVGMSGVLTLAIDSMKETIDALGHAGLLDYIKATIGGACASKEAMDVTGADAWSTNAAETVGVCLDWVNVA